MREHHLVVTNNEEKATLQCPLKEKTIPHDYQRIENNSTITIKGKDDYQQLLLEEKTILQ